MRPQKGIGLESLKERRFRLVSELINQVATAIAQGAPAGTFKNAMREREPTTLRGKRSCRGPIFVMMEVVVAIRGSQRNDVISVATSVISYLYYL
jgi:hypothetical protein